MEGETSAFTLTVPNDLATGRKTLKQSFSGKTLCRDVRQLITLGMEKLNKKNTPRLFRLI